jgi:hypothetical protein
MGEKSTRKNNPEEVDKLHVAEQIGRSIELSPHDSKHVRAMKIARRSFYRYADAYGKLAKMSEPE